MDSDEITLKLRDVRAASGLSLSKVAEMTGVSKAMLGQIERGESSPTIATLWKIAKGFQLPLSALIDTMNGDPSVFQTVTFPGSIEVKIVFPFDPALGAETFHVNLTPNQSHESPAHATGVTEEVFVLNGTLEITGEVRWYKSSEKARRGFCPTCGSALFWDHEDDPFICFSTGSIDGPTGLTLAEHIYTGSKGDYYTINPSDPQRED